MHHQAEGVRMYECGMSYDVTIRAVPRAAAAPAGAAPERGRGHPAHPVCAAAWGPHLHRPLVPRRHRPVSIAIILALQ